MKRKILILSTMAACMFVAACKKEAAVGPDVWATVNSKDISRAEVEKYFRTRVNAEAPAPSQEEALSLKLSILDELINNEILLERASKMNLIATDAEVEDKFTESKSPYTEEEFQRKLHDTGLTVDDLKNDIRRQLSVQKLLNREVIAKISITDQDVTDFYNKNRAQFNIAEPQYHIAQIVVTPHPDPSVHNRKNDKAKTDAEAKSKVAMLEQKLASGADFGQLAMDYSEDSTATTGGDLGFVPESALNRSDPALKMLVLSMKVGSVSQPIRQPGRLPHTENDRQGSCGSTRTFRSASATIHSRHDAQPQGATSSVGLYDRGARRFARYKLSGATNFGICRETSRFKLSDFILRRARTSIRGVI